MRTKVQDTIRKLFEDIPGLRISVLAHGDYCDAGRSYVTQFVDLTENQDKLVQFVKNVRKIRYITYHYVYNFVHNIFRGKKKQYKFGVLFSINL